MKKSIKTALIVLGSLLVGSCLLPLAFNGIFNVGSFFGFAVGSAALLCAMFGDRLSAFISKIRRSKAGKSLFIAFTSVICLFFSVFSVTLVCVLFNAGAKAREAETLIVLGCQVRGSVPSRQLRERIGSAEKYLKEHPDSVAVLSGGQGQGEEISEARCMFEKITGDGIDPDRLFLEDESTNTWENIRSSLAVIRENGLSEKTAVVTNDYHIARAKLIAKKAGLSAEGVSAFSDPTPVFYFREVFGIWWTLLGMYG